MGSELEELLNLWNVHGYFVLLITVGCSFRISYCFTRMISAEEQDIAMYKKRIKNCIVMVVIAVMTIVIKELIMRYIPYG